MRQTSPYAVQTARSVLARQRRPDRDSRLRVTLLVNPARPTPGGWRLVLWASWTPLLPHAVRLDLDARPRHPSLPTGRWFLPQPVLWRGLEAPVRHDEVSLYPDAEGERVWLTVPCTDRPWQAAVSRRRLGAFLDAISRGPQPSAAVC